ncbi:unnamed protein product, partial [Thlaspi arvense]
MSNEENITSIKADDKSGDSLDPGLEDLALLDELKNNTLWVLNLQNLTTKRTFDVKTLSPKITKRVLFLKDIQVLLNTTSSKRSFLKKKLHWRQNTIISTSRFLIRQRVENFIYVMCVRIIIVLVVFLRFTYHLQRYEIVNGEVEAEAEKEGVPNFWLIAMKTNEMLANEITERDEGALKYLKDIRCCKVENNSRNFKLEFLFDPNPYFKNSVLSKTYHVTDDDDDGPVLDKVIGTEIEWHPGKCLTHKVVVRKRPKKGSKKINNIPMTKTENCESFFNFFKPPEIHEVDEFYTTMDQELQNLTDQDYDI